MSDRAISPASHAGSWQTVWAEPAVKLAGSGRWEREQDLVLLERLELASSALSVGTKGAVRAVSSGAELELDGQLAYDLARLTELLRGPPLRIAFSGRGAEPFSVRGPLRGARGSAGQSLLEQMAVKFQLSWEAAQVQGFSIGPAVAKSELQGGILTLDPLDLVVSEGQVHVTPQFDLRGAQHVLRHGPGRVVENVRISPEMCQSWLKYLAPLVADATAADGRFSISLSNAATVPLDQPRAASAEGVLKVHSAQIGPGPLALRFIWLAEQVEAVLERRVPSATAPDTAQWIQLPEQEVPFRFDQQRVEHRGLQMVAGDVVIRTSGSVGLDQSLSLLAEVPIRDEWVARDQWLSTLRGQTLQIPVGGTMSNPQLDVRVLDQLARQLVGGAATRLIEQELQRGLDRLLRPRD
jgi:hypothetical protein